MPRGGQPNAPAIKNLKNLHGELSDIIELGVKSTGNGVKPGPGDITQYFDGTAWRIPDDPAIKKVLMNKYILPKLVSLGRVIHRQGGDLGKSRAGLPEIYIGGKRKGLNSVSKYVQEQIEKTGNKVTRPSFSDKESSAISKKARRDAKNLQSKDIKEEDRYDWDSTPEAMEGHHKRAIKIYAAFYEGLDPDGPEAKELTQLFVDEGFPLGDHKANIEDLGIKEHKEIHRWMQEQGIQVPVGKPGESNFLAGGTVRGGVDHELESVRKIPRPIIPNMSHLDINERRLAATEYLNFVQKPVEEQIEKIKKKVSLYHPKQSEIKRMRSIGLEWDDDAGKFNPIQKSNLPTEYSTNKPGGFNLSNLFSIGPDPRIQRAAITAENIIAHENRHIDAVGNVAGTVVEHGVNTYTGTKLGTNVRTAVNIAKKVKDKDYIGAALDATNLESVSYEKIVDPTKLTGY